VLATIHASNLQNVECPTLTAVSIGERDDLSPTIAKVSGVAVVRLLALAVQQLEFLACAAGRILMCVISDRV